MEFDSKCYFCNNGAKTQMTALRTYRHIIGAILLSLYTFITAPVQLWHHHTTDITSHKFKDSKHHSVSPADEAAADVICSICSHKYSTYNDDALHAFESICAETVVKNGYYPRSVIENISISFSNKGPPLIS